MNIHMVVQFLGFSHSSLRARTCWFMAPFVKDGTLIFAQRVIKDLGDFSLIPSPAKCAARIGQAFSQTFSSITIKTFSIIPDVERNGRTFSDGCGTCSSDVLKEVWKNYPQARGLKPTVLQIRFQGESYEVSSYVFSSSPETSEILNGSRRQRRCIARQ